MARTWENISTAEHMEVRAKDGPHVVDTQLDKGDVGSIKLDWYWSAHMARRLVEEKLPTLPKHGGL